MFAYLARVLLFFVAISVIRTVVQGVVRAYRGGNSSRGPTSHRPASGGPATSPDGSTLLHQDPVCGTYVAASSSLRKISKGKVYHFCSEECRDRFNARFGA
jgi:YHS domain-containing protein